MRSRPNRHAIGGTLIAGLLAGTATPARAGDVLDWATSLMSGCWSCDTLGQLVKIGLAFAEKAFTTLAGETPV